jgi:hypothetical protein
MAFGLPAGTGSDGRFGANQGEYMSDDPGKTGRRTKAPFDPGVQAHIGRQLKAMFDEVVHEPMPDNLVRLLDALQTPAAEPMPGTATAGRKPPERP